MGLAIDETEERFRGYFEQSLVGAMVARPDRGLEEVNQAACDLLGYSREELLSLTWADITHPDDLAADIARNKRILAGEISSARFEKRFIRKDGAVVHADMNLSCQRRPDGSVDYFLALVSDVTDRRRLADELDDERLRFKLLVENSGEAFILSEPDGVIDFANAAACQMFGHSAEEMRRLGRDGLVDHTDPRLDVGLDIKRQTGKFVGEMRFLRGDGTVFTGEISTNEYRDHDGKERTSTVIRDLTEAKRGRAGAARRARPSTGWSPTSTSTGSGGWLRTAPTCTCLRRASASPATPPRSSLPTPACCSPSPTRTTVPSSASISTLP